MKDNYNQDVRRGYNRLDDIFSRARKYAELGYEVFPLVPDKKEPITQNGCNDATTDQEQINRWIEEFPDANIGIKAGSDVLILDIDNKDGKNGSLDLAEIEKELGSLSDCPKTETPTGGNHLYFKHPGVEVKGQAGVEWKGRKTGIDIRVGNQYVVAPTSIHPDTRTKYLWGNKLVPKNELPGLPQAWIDHFLPLRDKVVPKAKPANNLSATIVETPRTVFPLVLNGEVEHKAVKYLDTCPKAMQGRSGHNTLCSVARALVRGFALGPQRAADIAWEYYNLYCFPFWTEGERKDFDRKFFEAAKWNCPKSDGWLLNDTEGSAKLEWVPFPVDEFPTSMKNYIVESAKSLNVDPAYIGVFTLSVVASMIGSGFRIQLKPGWREPSIINTALVASSGSGKSPGMDAANEPLHIIQNNADKKFMEAEADYERELTIYKAKLKKWNEGLGKNPSSTPPVKPISPVPKAYIADDTTPEALIEILSENPFGVCMPKDELSGWLGGIGAYGKGKDTKELAFWLAVHGCRSHRVNRKGSGGTKKFIFASTPAVSICGGIQPGMLLKILTENKHFFDSGFMARILFAMPPDQSQRWTYDVVSDKTKKQYRNLIKGILSWRSSTDGNSLNPEEPDIITLSESAELQFADLCDANGEEREQMESDTQKAFFPKLTGYAARIALVFHLVKWWDNETVDYDTVDGETMESAIQLSHWFKREALRINEAMRGEAPQVDLEAAAIIRVIRRKGKLTAADIARYVRTYHVKGGSEKAKIKMVAMVQNGQLVADDREANNGAMVKEFSLSDAVYANNVYAIPEFTENGIDGVDNGVDADFDAKPNENKELENGVDGVDGFRHVEWYHALPEEVEKRLLEAGLAEEPDISLPDEVEIWLLGAAMAEESVQMLSEKAEAIWSAAASEPV